MLNKMELSDKEKLNADIKIVLRHIDGILSNPLVYKDSETYFFIDDAAKKLKEEFDYLKERRD